MKIIPLFLMTTILCISLASADLIIHTQPMQINQKVNTEKTYQMILENTFDFDIEGFEFSELSEMGFSFPNIVIPKNTTKNIDFIVNPTTGFHGQKTSKISFKFEVKIPEITQTHTINLTNKWGMHETIYARDGDTIVWNNMGTETRELTAAEFGESKIILVNESASYGLNQIGTLHYYARVAGEIYSEGIIEVINKTSDEMVHNQDYDANLVLNIDITAKPTNLSVSLSKDNFEIEYMKFKKGLMTINNTGNEIAEKTELSSDSEWVSFNKNKIDLSQGEEDWVEYTITPLILNTNQTNKTYSINIVTKALNSEEKINKIEVFIPYKLVSDEIGDSDLEYLNWLDKVYCVSHPTSFLCDPETSEGNGSIIYKDVEIPINITGSDFYDTLRRLQRLEDSNERTNNELKLMGDNFNKQMPGVTEMVNESLELQKKNEKKEGIRKRTNWIIVFFISLAVMATGIIKLVNKRSYKKLLAEGAYKYRR